MTSLFQVKSSGISRIHQYFSSLNKEILPMIVLVYRILISKDFKCFISLLSFSFNFDRIFKHLGVRQKCTIWPWQKLHDMAILTGYSYEGLYRLEFQNPVVCRKSVRLYSLDFRMWLLALKTGYGCFAETKTTGRNNNILAYFNELIVRQGSTAEVRSRRIIC